MSSAYSTVTTVIVLLLVSSAVAMATKWVRVPYTVALVIVGLIVSPFNLLPAVHMSPDLIFLVFLPTLLFEAAWNLNLKQLRRRKSPIAILSTAGVVVSMVVVAAVLHSVVVMKWSSALLFGAIISATDPVSVLALFRALHAPSQLTTIIEAESLFNDGTAAVLFSIVLAFTTGDITYSGVTALLLRSIAEFCLVAGGGLLVGLGVGFVSSKMTAPFDDHLLEITLTTITAYGSFLLAQRLHVSPVIAVLAAGLVVGNYGRNRAMSRTTEVAVTAFWEYAAFVVNSLVFLLIGLQTRVPEGVDGIQLVTWAVVAMLMARALTVYGLMSLLNLTGKQVSLAWQHILFWGGLRGSLSIALALSLPADIELRAPIITMTFGVVAFTLLVQGLTISPLIKRLKPGDVVESPKGAA